MNLCEPAIPAHASICQASAIPFSDTLTQRGER